MQTTRRVKLAQSVSEDDEYQREGRDDSYERRNGEESNWYEGCWDDDEESEKFERLR